MANTTVNTTVNTIVAPPTPRTILPCKSRDQMEGKETQTKANPPTGTIQPPSSPSSATPAPASLTAKTEREVKMERKKKNRCMMCNKKLGIVPFECKCGDIHCSAHRYPDTHSCPIDYRKLAQEQLKKNNPVVVADKVPDRI